MIILCKIHLKHVVEQVHCGTAHVNGDGVEEEDGVVLGHAENHHTVIIWSVNQKKQEEERLTTEKDG